MAKKYLISLFIIASVLGQEKTQDISGIIVDMDNLEPLPYANVVLQGLNRGITSNSDGHFVLVDVPAEPCSLIVSYIGYRTARIGYDNSAPGRHLDIRLKMEALNFQGVDVIADEYQIIKSSGEEISKVTLSPRQLALLPNMGEVDIFRSLQLLPGISSTGDGSSGINVRGGSSNQNMILLDGMNIYHVDHFFGMFSAFNADAIKDVQVYKGGFPAKYGGRLSSVIDMTGKNGDLTRRQFGLGANLMSTQLLYETPIIMGGSWLLSFRRSYSDFMSSPFFDKMYEFVTGDDEVPTNNRRQVNPNNPNQNEAFQQQIFPTFYFYDLHNKVTFTPGNKDVISISMYGGRDFLNESRETQNVRVRPGGGGFGGGGGGGGFGGGGGQQTITRIDDNNTDWGNLAVSLRWNHRWTDRFSSQTLFSSSRFKSNYDRHLYFQGGSGRYFKIDEGNGSLSKLIDGSETFVDQNNNGLWDSGDECEELIDTMNGICDIDEEFIDGNGVYDEGEEFVDELNGVWDEGEQFVDVGNGEYDQGESFVDINDNGQWDNEQIVYLSALNSFDPTSSGEIVSYNWGVIDIPSGGIEYCSNNNYTTLGLFYFLCFLVKKNLYQLLSQ